MMPSTCNPLRCKSVNNIGATLDTWEDLVRQCAAGGGEFVLNSRQKDMALIQLVPEEIETIYETDTKYRSYVTKLEYVRWRSSLITRPWANAASRRPSTRRPTSIGIPQFT